MFKKIKNIMTSILTPLVRDVIDDLNQTIVERMSEKKIRDFEYVSTCDPEKIDEMTLPQRGTDRSAGYDIFNNTGERIMIIPGEISDAIPTGIKAYMLDDEYLEIVPRSSVGWKYSTRLANTVGIIDADYYNNEKNEGEIFIKLHNQGDKAIVIEPNQAFVQGIFKKYLITDTDEPINSSRNGGVGSTDGNGEV